MSDLLTGSAATPKELGFTFPAEWHPHRATWLTFPHNDASWQGERLGKMRPQYLEFIKTISLGEQVGIVANDEKLKGYISEALDGVGVDLSKIEFVVKPTNDAWCRDHGPAFLINKNSGEKMIVDWGHNAWGGKYPPYDDDNRTPAAIAAHLGLPLTSPGIIMEGGAVEFNGAGSVLTSKSCLLNLNRNPHLNQGQIEEFLCNFYGVEQVLWVEGGIEGDDTDGHIDDTTRFVNEDTIVAAVEHDPHDDNYGILQTNLSMLKAMRLVNGKQLNIIELPMPKAVIIDDFRTPGSYANFLICNAGVIVPVFENPNDAVAIDILEKAFPDRKVIPLKATEIIWGQGSFHCLSQQEPLV
ncbi:agmatine deiminase family protein [Dyadobacter sandarakinus]|uniref:Agmatine deiminase family protein n=1 Tax=Dyadobacter sandarakinus TaxID=2747268 RepID=A0ABX7ICW7_9BACT|nr:agmatine deiminase family protein [Dyadobacter sandarakinus]QRR03830.1 agmatine deiminase family protein [Dyadobacter sandarakinus]